MFRPLQLDKLYIESPIFAAPLAGVTDLPYRKILREIAPFAPLMTEMNSCHSLIQNAKAKRNSDDFSAEGLIGAQIFGADPAAMAEGARILESRGAKWIDVNMGCPVPKVATRALAGANLMRDHKLAGEIVAAIRKAVKIPISIKTRLGWDAGHLDSAELIKICADSGAGFATVHGRTRAQGYSGKADWDAIARIKESSPIPIIANGDIRTHDDIARVRDITNCDGVMLARVLLGNPYALSSRVELSPARHPREAGGPLCSSLSRSDTILRHLDYSLAYYGLPNGVYMFRKHLAWYSAGMPGGAEFRAKIFGLTDPGEMRQSVAGFFS
ncbi:MAG: tRNA-dihydrouridine synthase [Rickettsiales bacterium]|jgi:tRNA-dihydrouridine synthase B|nr:tRNA-dihydrouridine synthase [Rickettsiales bacterium]